VLPTPPQSERGSREGPADSEPWVHPHIAQLGELERRSPLLQSIDSRLVAANSSSEIEELLRIRETALGQELNGVLVLAAIDSRVRANSVELRSRERRERFELAARILVFVTGIIFLVVAIAVPGEDTRGDLLLFLAGLLMCGSLAYHLTPEWAKLFMERLPTLVGGGTPDDDPGT
jgi:hypothetical protein